MAPGSSTPTRVASHSWNRAPSLRDGVRAGRPLGLHGGRRSAHLPLAVRSAERRAARTDRTHCRCRACRVYVGCRSRPTAQRLSFAGLALNSQIWSQPIRADGSARGEATALTRDTSRRTSMAVDLAGWIAHRLHVLAQGRSAECVGDGCRRQPQGAGDVERCGGRQAQLVPRRRTPRLLLESRQERRLVVTRRIDAARNAAARRRGADAPAVRQRPSGGDGAVAVPDSRRPLGRQRAGCPATALHDVAVVVRPSADRRLLGLGRLSGVVA